MKKHVLTLFAVLLPMLASAQIKVEIDGIYYNLIPKAKLAEVTFKGSYPNDSRYTGSITIPATVTYNGVVCNVTSIGKEAFYDSRYCGITSITIPESVTSIGESAFAYCKYLETITILKNSQLTEIKEGAFRGCRSLTSITIPEGVTSIGDHAFRNCDALTSITIPEGVISIGNYAFADCYNLTSISIPENVTSIGAAAFSECKKLISITIPEGSQLTGIHENTFENCHSLTAITLPKRVIAIGTSAFEGCSKLTSIILPEGVTVIGPSAFYGCGSLTTIVLPKNLSEIFTLAFAKCLELRDVYCYAEKGPFARIYMGQRDVFDGSFPEYMTLHVPANALNTYKTTYPWDDFGNIVAIEENETWSNIGNIVAAIEEELESNSASFPEGFYAVDLGLSVKWASCNVGAESPEEYGGYYAWGETEEKNDYSTKTYKYYNTEGYEDIGSNISGTSYDVAHVKLGSGWRMPTEDEINELCNKCSWEWTSIKGVSGQKVTGPNGNSIFLPAAGFRLGDDVYGRGANGNYWSSSLNSSNSYGANFLYFDSSGHDWGNYGRDDGRTVRPVTE